MSFTHTQNKKKIKNYVLNLPVPLDVTIMDHIFRILYKIRVIGKERWY